MCLRVGIGVDVVLGGAKACSANRGSAGLLTKHVPFKRIVSQCQAMFTSNLVAGGKYIYYRSRGLECKRDATASHLLNVYLPIGCKENSWSFPFVSLTRS